MKSVNLPLLFSVFIVSLVSIFYWRGEMIIESKNKGQESTQQVMDLFRQRGRHSLLPQPRST